MLVLVTEHVEHDGHLRAGLGEPCAHGAHGHLGRLAHPFQLEMAAAIIAQEYAARPSSLW